MPQFLDIDAAQTTDAGPGYMIPAFSFLRRGAAAASFGLLASTTTLPASAADLSAPKTDQASPAVPREWTLSISPYLWAASLNGDAGAFGFQRSVDVPFRDTLKNLNAGVMGNIEIGNGVFGAYLNGQYVDVSSDERLGRYDFGVGMRSTLVAVGAYYRVYEAALGGSTVNGTPRIFALEPTAGVRWSRMTGRLGFGSFHISHSEGWLDPYLGMRAQLDLTDRWNLMLEGDVGGFGAGTRLSLNGQAYLGYRTELLGRPTILRAGYRALYQDYRDGSFQWKVTQHGPIIGATFQF